MASYCEKEFSRFLEVDRAITRSYRVREVWEDLFSLPVCYSLVHCVATDFKMSRGIAVTFKQRFGGVADLLAQDPGVGGLALLPRYDRDGFVVRYIYYLTTKCVSWDKPTYETLWHSLYRLRDHVREYNVRRLAMPTIGCGLDGLDWGRVRVMLEFLFQDSDVEILVCHYQ